jgi:hypothetical protein
MKSKLTKKIIAIIISIATIMSFVSCDIENLEGEVGSGVIENIVKKPTNKYNGNLKETIKPMFEKLFKDDENLQAKVEFTENTLGDFDKVYAILPSKYKEVYTTPEDIDDKFEPEYSFDFKTDFVDYKDQLNGVSGNIKYNSKKGSNRIGSMIKIDLNYKLESEIKLTENVKQILSIVAADATEEKIVSGIKLANSSSDKSNYLLKTDTRSIEILTSEYKEKSASIIICNNVKFK